MKTLALFITVAGLISFLAGDAFANDPANPSRSKTAGERIGPVIPAQQPATKGESPVHPNDKSKAIQLQRVSPTSPAPKSSLPVSAGQQRGLAVVGGTGSGTQHKNGAINGTELRRSP